MQYLEINASGTKTVKTGAGFLQGITINNAGTSWTLQIFDNTTNSAPAIAGGTAAFTIPVAGSYLDYDVHFSKGLTLVTSGTAGSITVEYY